MSILADWEIEKEIQISPMAKCIPRKGVMSYGLTSYGYDVRVWRDYKVFTNVFGALVDPKSFDPKSFVDFVDVDYCIIPPNSFALARALEHISMPEKMLGLCVGKCLTGDTWILCPTTGELKRICDIDLEMSVVSERYGSLEACLASKKIVSGEQEVFEVKTKSGLIIKATEQHPFKVRYGYIPLNRLEKGMELACAGYLPFYGSLKKDIREVRLFSLLIADGQCKTPCPRYSKQDEMLVSMLQDSAIFLGMYAEEMKTAPNQYLITNQIGRGGIVEKNRCALWLKNHDLNTLSKDKVIPKCIFQLEKELLREFLKVLFSGDGSVYLASKERRTPTVIVEYDSASKILIMQLRHLLLRFGIWSTQTEKKTYCGHSYRLVIHRKQHIARFFKEIGFVEGCYKDLTFRESIAQWIDTGINNPENIVYDEVKSVTRIGIEKVYDLTVPMSSNFVANDLIVHNSSYARCGIILNVTPIEPLWRGHVTLEITNSTPLPCKIYSEEGICQIIFLRGEHSPMNSYSSKGGIYQDQTGITLPRVRGGEWT